MAARRILPVEPAAAPGVTVVVEVQQHGIHPLDVRLVGCEGENPYVTTLEHRNLGKWKHKFNGSDSEWATLLSCLLLQTPPQEAHVSLLHGVCLLYTLKPHQLELSIRRDVGDIKVTLGAIHLPRDDEFEFNPFEWAQASAVAHAQTQQQLADMKMGIAREQDTIAQLQAQLHDLIQAKREAEMAMLQQFMVLLNAKKRKIRDQSRILSREHVDHDTAPPVPLARAAGTSRKATASSSTKRKASAHTTTAQVKAVSDDESMDLDTGKEEDLGEYDDGTRIPATPDRTDDSTDAEVGVAVPRRSTRRGAVTRTLIAREDEEEEEGEDRDAGIDEDEDETEDDEL